MRRLLALGLGCLVSVTASSEDLLTIFDQAVVNDPAGPRSRVHAQGDARSHAAGLGRLPAADQRQWNKGKDEGTG